MEKVFKKRELRRLPGKKMYYADGTTPVEEQKENYKGKGYFSFTNGKLVFVVHEDDQFIQDWDKSNVAEVTIDITDEGAQFLNHATYSDLLAEATFEGDLDFAKNRYKYHATGERTIVSEESKAVL